MDLIEPLLSSALELMIVSHDCDITVSQTTALESIKMSEENTGPVLECTQPTVVYQRI